MSRHEKKKIIKQVEINLPGKPNEKRGNKNKKPESSKARYQ